MESDDDDEHRDEEEYDNFEKIGKGTSLHFMKEW